MNIFWGIRSEPPLCCHLNQQEVNNPSTNDDLVDVPDTSDKWLDYFQSSNLEISHSHIISFLKHATPSPEYYKYIQFILPTKGVRDSFISHNVLSILLRELQTPSKLLYETCDILIDPTRQFQAYSTSFVSVPLHDLQQKVDKSFMDAVISSLNTPFESHQLDILGTIALQSSIPTSVVLDLIGRLDIAIDIQLKAFLIILLTKDFDILHLELNVYAMVSCFLSTGIFFVS
jgi:hypothetical protein